MTNSMAELAEKLRDTVMHNAGVRDEYQDWTDVREDFDKIIAALRGSSEPGACAYIGAPRGKPDPCVLSAGHSGPHKHAPGASQAINSIDDVAAICHSVTGLCCHILGSPGGPCTIGNCAAVRGYLGGPEFAVGASRDASPGEPVYRKWPGEPPHCMSCDCGMTDEQKRTVPEADYLRIHKELMDLKYPGSSPADLVGALQDVVHTDPGPVRAAHAVRDASSEPYEHRCEDRITLNDVVWRCTKPANHRDHERQPEAALRDVPYLSRHDWQMLPGGSYECLRCRTQCLDAHDAKLCSVNAQRTGE